MYYNKKNIENSEDIKDSEILGFSVYEFNKDNEVVHNFFLKTDNKFVLKFFFVRKCNGYK